MQQQALGNSTLGNPALGNLKPLGTRSVETSVPTMAYATQYPSHEQGSEHKLPAKKLRAGSISVTIWNNDAVKDGRVNTYQTLNIERGYQDRQGVWKNAKSFRVSDIPKVVTLLNKAYESLIFKNQSTEEV